MAWTAPRDWTGISNDIVTAAMLNVDVRDNLGVLSTHTHTGAAGMGGTSMSGLTLAALTTLTFANQSANPDAAGELQRNGNDLLFYGASAVNLTQADASAGTASLRSLGTTSVKAAAGNHGHSFADLTATLANSASDVEQGSGNLGGMSTTIQNGGSNTLVASITQTAADTIPLVAVAFYVVQGLLTDTSYRCALVIDGTTITTVDGVKSEGSALIIVHKGMKVVSSGSRVITATVTNLDASDDLLAVAQLAVFGVQAS
jgi:hypothetical protein